MSFLRENARNLQIVVVVVAVLVVGWVLYDQYTDLQENKGASLLASALQETAVEQKSQTLNAVVEQYPKTDAALWSIVELAHLDYQAGKFQEAAGRYEAILADLPASLVMKVTLVAVFIRESTACQSWVLRQILAAILRGYKYWLLGGDVYNLAVTRPDGVQIESGTLGCWIRVPNGFSTRIKESPVTDDIYDFYVRNFI